MADKITITITNDPARRDIDGTYAIDVPFTNWDGHMLKEIAGVRIGEINEALEAGDNDVLVAFGYIGLHRHGKNVPVEALWKLPLGCIAVELPQAEEADADPPPQKTEPAETGSAVVRPISSGADSKQSSENQGNGLSATGDRTSAIGQGFA